MTAPTQPQQPSSVQPDGFTVGDAAQLALLLYTFKQATQVVRGQLSNYVTALWRSLGFYDNAAKARFIAQVVPAVVGAQQHMASLTAAHLAQMTATARGVPFTPVGLNPTKVSGAAVRKGVDPVEVYGRPFHLVWRQLADLPREPGSIDQAINAGETRAVQTALTDLQLAKTHAARQSMADDSHIVGYRRVLEGAYSCGLCIVSSTLRYHKATLLPIHGGCDCDVAPIYGDHDPGKVLNEQLLGDVHAAIADRFGKSSAAARIVPGAKDGRGKPLQYKDVLVTHEHGELGPVLGVKGQPFTGPNDLNS